jgi:hypothetical protein
MLFLLFTDETNLQPSDTSQFFIYGGVFVPAEKLIDLHNLVESIRKKYEYEPANEFKFTPTSKPPQVSRENFTMAKHDVLLGLAELDIKFAACLTLHEIARERSLEELIRWGANSIIATFDHFLETEKGTGICIMDRLPFVSGYQYLQEKFQTGLIFPDGKTKRLNRIHMFATSCEGASHAISAIDILLGSFRYCVNERNKTIAPRQMFPSIVKMMWHLKVGNTLYLRDRGLLFRPKTVRLPAYQNAYNDLTEHLITLLNTPNK